MRCAERGQVPMVGVTGVIARMLAGAWLLLAAVTAQAVTVSAVQNLSCAADRFGSDLNCTANEFTIVPVFSAEPGTPPFCMANQEFRFVVDLVLEGSNTIRYDAGFFVGQTGNDPQMQSANPASPDQCSVATFPFTPAPYADKDGDTCGDLESTANSSTAIRIDEIKVVCAADAATDTLSIPYILGYSQNPGTLVCGSSPTPQEYVMPGAKSKCSGGAATVSGVVAVHAGVWVDITKQTTPDGQSQPFTFTATGPAGTKVIALTGATLTPTASTGGTYVPATIALASNATTFTLADGETARVFMSGAATARDLTIVETPLPTGWDPTASISCASVQGAPGVVTNNATRTITASLDTTNAAAACTITNIKRPSITITKVSNGDTGSFTFTGTNTWSSQTIPTVTAGVGVTGATQYLPYSTATVITESVTAGFRLTGISCTGMGAGGNATYDVGNRQVSFDAAAMAPGSDIACTFTNVRQRTLTVNKTLSGGGGGLFVMDANGTTGAAAGNGATASALVDVGSTATFAETGSGGTNLANYTSTYSCNTAPVTSGSGTSGSFTMPNADVTCTLTNTRKSAQLTLAKTWVNGKTGDTTTVSSTGFTNNASSGASVAAGNNTTTGTAVTVYAGEAGSIAEAFSVGTVANYTPTLACTGTSGLSGSTLTIDPADTAITCTLTNTRKSAQLTLAKTWVNGRTGDTTTVSSTGFANNASSGASVAAGNNTTTGSAVTVYAAESGSISEAFSVGTVANYTPSLACTGTSGLSGSTLTVDPADTAIACTLTNTRKSAQLTLAKTWVNGKTGDTATVASSGFTNEASSGASVSTGANTTTGTAVTVYAGESAAIDETFSVGTAANYAVSRACTGTAGLSGSTLTIDPADSSIACTLTNTRKSAQLALRKTWANGITNDAVTVSTTGFANNATSGVSTSTGNNSTTGAAVTVYAGEAGTITESFSNGSAANYTATLGCSGSAGLSGNTLTVDPADSNILCTTTNTRNSATLTLRKVWLDAISGDTAEVTSSGFTNNATSGASVSTGSNTTTGTPVTVYAAESGSITEAFTVGSAGNYQATLACAGTSGLSGNTLVVGGADTVIVCTYTNEKLKPILDLLKSMQVVSDPVNGVANPKAIPGSVQSVTLRLTNSGAGMVDNNSLDLKDPLPPLVELYVADLAGAGQGPVVFTDGSPASGLAWVFNDLSDLTDSVDFSDDNGATWNYVPAPDGNGYDAAVTHIRLRPQGAMNATGGGDPWAEFTFRVRLQ